MGILDFYHASQNLWKAAADWLDGVWADLAEALEVESLPDSVRETLMTVYACLEPHRDHIDYEAYKDLG
jgi:hypothetical protein